MAKPATMERLEAERLAAPPRDPEVKTVAPAPVVRDPATHQIAPAVLPGDTVWYWLVKDGRLTPCPAELLWPARTTAGRWVANRHGRGVLVKCEGAFADAPQEGCFTLRKADWFKG